MTGPDFRAWRKRLGLRQSDAATALGISVSRINEYEAGVTRVRGTPAPIPQTVALACAHIEGTPK